METFTKATVIAADLAILAGTLTAAWMTLQGDPPARRLYPPFILLSAACLVVTVMTLGPWWHVIPAATLGFWGGAYAVRWKRQF